MKNKYPVGTRIELIHMDDPYHPVESGTKGTVKFVDDAGQIHMQWDNGRSLALVEGVDDFKVIEEEEIEMDFFDTDKYAIIKYEEELPDMLMGAHQDYEHGNLNEKAYADALRRIYTIIELLYVEGIYDVKN